MGEVVTVAGTSVIGFVLDWVRGVRIFLDDDDWLTPEEVVEIERRLSDNHCAYCGKPRHALDLAWIEDQPYCHGSFDPSPTCYERISWTSV